MEWDKSKNTYTNEQLDKILEQHKLWIDTDGKRGKQANLSGAVLIGLELLEVNLIHANLRQAVFTGSNLIDADFAGADLQETNFNNANLTGADLSCTNAVNATFMHARLVDARFYKANLTEGFFIDANVAHADFNEASLINANFASAHMMGANFGSANLQNAFLVGAAMLDTNFEKANLKGVKLLDPVTQNLFLKQNILETQEILAKSLISADNNIRENSMLAKFMCFGAIVLIGLDVYVIINFWLSYKHFIPLFEKLGIWILTLFSFPLIVILTIAITLLRHQKKLLDEVRHYSAEKRQIELYSGLLKASQHAVAGFHDPQESAEYVKETFTAIRNRILSEQPHNNTAASASEKEDYDQTSFLKTCVDITNKAVDIISKNSEKK